MNEDIRESFINRDTVYEGSLIQVYRDKVRMPDGREAFREVVAHPGAVGIVAESDEGEIFLVKQYRHPVREILAEIPAGKLERGEEPIECAKRELEEELGLRSNNIRQIALFYNSPGFSNESFHLFKAAGLETLKDPMRDKDEFLVPFKVSKNKAVEMIMNGSVKDAKSIIGILMCADFCNL